MEPLKVDISHTEGKVAKMKWSHHMYLFTGAGAQWDKGTFVKPCGMIQLMLLEDQ